MEEENDKYEIRIGYTVSLMCSGHKDTHKANQKYRDVDVLPIQRHPSKDCWVLRVHVRKWSGGWLLISGAILVPEMVTCLVLHLETDGPEIANLDSDKSFHPSSSFYVCVPRSP